MFKKMLFLIFLSGCVVYLPNEDLKELVKNNECEKNLKICETNNVLFEKVCDEVGSRQ